MRREVVLVLIGIAGAILVACSPNSDDSSLSTPPADQELTPVLATRSLRVGTQRVAFLLATKDSWLRAPEVSVTLWRADEGSPTASASALGFPWPEDLRMTYVTELTFDAPGAWRLDIKTGTQNARLDLDVARTVPVVEIGEPAPPSQNITLGDVKAIEEISSDWTPDPGLYQLTIAEAVRRPLPTVLVFATPSFCTTPTCGPQVDTVSLLKENFHEIADFIHIEIYRSPDQPIADLTKAEIAPSVREWGISKVPGWINESWVFILTQDGCIAERYEAYASYDELSRALERVLEHPLRC